MNVRGSFLECTHVSRYICIHKGRTAEMAIYRAGRRIYCIKCRFYVHCCVSLKYIFRSLIVLGRGKGANVIFLVVINHTRLLLAHTQESLAKYLSVHYLFKYYTKDYLEFFLDYQMSMLCRAAGKQA